VIHSILLMLILALALGCTNKGTGSEVKRDQSIGIPEVAPATDAWVGQWNAPEGTYLQITGGKGVYEITIKNLDQARIFQGSSVNDHIEFQRDGVTESLRSGSGDETGMKWLAGRADCLVIKLGEGFCRD
jgi:hypothetical protein